jgi:hypothetical protein
LPTPPKKTASVAKKSAKPSGVFDVDFFDHEAEIGEESEEIDDREDDDSVDNENLEDFEEDQSLWHEDIAPEDEEDDEAEEESEEYAEFDIDGNGDRS